MSRWHQFGVTLPLLLCLAVPGALAQDIRSLELLLPWDGATRPDRDSEFGVRVGSTEGGKISLTFVGGAVPISITLSVPPGAERTVWIPYRPDPAVPVRIERVAGGTVEVASRRHRHRRRPGKVVAIAAPVPGGKGDGGFIPVAANTLPRTPHGYDQIDALVIGLSELAALDTDQLAAFQGYLGLCGRTVVLGSGAGPGAVLRPMAGCGAAYLAIVPDLAAAATAVKRLLARAPPALPGVEDLRGLLPARSAADRTLPLILFLALWVGAVVLAVFLSRRAAPALIVSAACCLLAVAVWFDRAPHRTAAVWAEADSGAQTAREATLLRMEGRGRGRFFQPVPAGSVPTRLPAGYRLSVSRPANGGASFGITASSHLFETRYVALRTRTVALPSLAFRWRNGAPAVSNIADDVSPSLLVSWQKSLFRPPDLPAGAVWTAREATPFTGELDAAGRLFARRAASWPAAYLTPIPPSSRATAPGIASMAGWALVGLRGRAATGGP